MKDLKIMEELLKISGHLSGVADVMEWEDFDRENCRKMLNEDSQKLFEISKYFLKEKND